MTDKPETPMQRALRMKTEALAARNTPAAGGNQQREAAAAPQGKSKPWMKK